MDGSQFHILGSNLIPAEVRRPLRVLSIDGDIRGLSTILILKDIMKEVGNRQGRTVQPWEEFDLIAGTSIGGLIAIMLGRLKMSLDECQAAFLELSRTIFNLRRPTIKIFERTKDRLRANGRLNTHGLEKAIKQLLTSRGLTEDEIMTDPSSACKVFVCATASNDTTPTLLRSYENTEKSQLLDGSCKIWEACLATFSTMSCFEPTIIGALRQKFAAGGVETTNPITISYEEANSIWPNRLGQAILVSIGGGGAPSGPFEGKLKQISELVANMTFQAETTTNDFFERHQGMIQQGRLYRLGVQAEISIQEYNETARVANATTRYLQAFNVRQKVKACVDSLEQQIEDKSKVKFISPSPIEAMETSITMPEGSSLPQAIPENTASPTLLAKLVGIYWSEDNLRQMNDRHLPLLAYLDPSQFEESYGHLDIPWYPVPDEKYCTPEILLDIDPGYGFLVMSPESRTKGRCLCLAILLNDYDLVRSLLKAGANPNFRDQIEFSATEHSFFSAQLASKKTFRETPLALATLMNEKGIMRILIDAGSLINEVHPRTGSTLLHSASYACDESVVKLLLEEGAEPIVRDGRGRSPLHCATYGKPVRGRRPADMPGANIPVMELLLKHGLNLDDADYFGFTPLHVAVYTYQESATEWLLEKGASPNAKTKEGETPIDFLYTRSHKRIDEETICLLLILYGAFTDTQYGRTSLHNAIMSWKRPYLGYLLSGSLQSTLKVSCLKDIDAQDIFGRSPLHYAVLGCQGDNIKDLLRAGANPNLKDKRGYAAIHYAASDSDSVSCLHELLRSSKTDMALLGPNDITALHLVVQWKQRLIKKWTRRPWEFGGSEPTSRDYDILDILDSLLKATAPDVKTKLGFTPLSLALLHTKTASNDEEDEDYSNDDAVSRMLKESNAFDEDIVTRLLRHIRKEPEFYLHEAKEENLPELMEAYGFANTHRFENDARLPIDNELLVPKIEGIDA